MGLENALTEIGRKLLEIVMPLTEELKEIFSSMEEPYQAYELLHPRKKPRGSIRRNKGKRGNNGKE